MPIPDLATLRNERLFEIVGTNRPAYVALEVAQVRGEDRLYVASVVYKGLSATCEVTGLEPAVFRSYFVDLAEHWRGWEGVKGVSSLDGEFSVGCEYQATFRTPEVWFTVRLALDHSDPYWVVELRLEVPAEALHDLAERARAFFRTPA